MTHIPWYDFNSFDYVVIGIVVLSTIISFFRGFVREALSLLVWTIGLILAFKFAPVLQPYIHSFIKVKALSFLIGFGLIFIAVWLVGLLIHLTIRSVVQRVGLGGTDRIIGLLFGFARGLLVVVVGLMFVSMSPYKNSETFQHSALAPHFQTIVTKLDKYVPQDVEPLAHWAMGGK